MTSSILFHSRVILFDDVIYHFSAKLDFSIILNPSINQSLSFVRICIIVKHNIVSNPIKSSLKMADYRSMILGKSAPISAVPRPLSVPRTVSAAAQGVRIGKFLL